MKNNRRFPTLAITFVLLLSLFSPAASAVSTANANLTPTSNSEKIADIMEAGEQYMGADIEETGISACITKEGRLQVICELAAPATRSGASDSEMKRYVLSTLLVVDQFSNEVPYSAKVLENTGSSQDVYAVHTTYIDYRADPDNPGLLLQDFTIIIKKPPKLKMNIINPIQSRSPKRGEYIQTSLIMRNGIP